jgi:GGDEF domain-containing protein
MSAVDHASRIALQHAVAQRADELRRAVDPALAPEGSHEQITRLTCSLGVVAASHDEPSGDLEDALVDHAAHLLLWLESIECERRAG